MTWQFDGAYPYLQPVGHAVSDAGDFDGDGFDDVIVGAPFSQYSAGVQNDGIARVYSGATGAILRGFGGQRDGDRLGWSVSGAGDVDGDGFDDVIVGAPRANPGGGYWGGVIDAGSVYVYSYFTGLIWQFDGQAAYDRLGESVSGAGDVDGDGFDDLIVGAIGTSPGGSAYVYSGATGAVIWQFDGQASGDEFGYAVSDAGDFDGDGTPDVIVGARFTDPGGLSDAGSAYVYSGATGTLIWQFDGQAAGDHLGNSVSGAGDVDGDGFDDVIVGAYYALGQAGSAYVYSGATGSLIWQFDGPGSYRRLGTSVSGAGDVDGDGIDDVIVGAPAEGGIGHAGSAYVYSGASGSLIRQFDGQLGGDQLGFSVSGAGDVNGDGIADVVSGAPLADPGGAANVGSAYVFSLNPFLHMDPSELSASVGTAVQLTLDFPASEAGANYVVLASKTGIGPITLAGLQIPLTMDSLLQRLALGNPPANLTNSLGTLDANGDAIATIQAGPLVAPAVGGTIYIAAISFDSGPAVGRFSSIVRYLSIVP